MRIGGNVQGIIQVKTNKKNEYGERIPEWNDALTLTGFLDLSNGTSDFLNADAKIQDSTHIFICDYVDLSKYRENTRMHVGNDYYTIQLIDDPMGLREHLEIYLKYMEGVAADG